jgi:ribosomal protein S18 acetylase RimI-like enzyme
MRYPKECILKDCEEVIIRPLTADDEAALNDFYSCIPEDDRWNLRYDTTKPEIIHSWIEKMTGGRVISIIALCNNKIVAHGSLRHRGFGITKHVGRFHIAVLPEYRNKRLGTWILLDIVQMAMDKGLELLRADLIVGMEDAAIEAARKLDFIKRAELKNYAQDPQGNRYDMIIMIKRLHKDWSDF